MFSTCLSNFNLLSIVTPDSLLEVELLIVTFEYWRLHVSSRVDGICHDLLSFDC